MRKLFVLLLIALVPLSIGCRLTENDDAGPDVTPVQNNRALFNKPTVILPDTLAKSLRAAVPASDLTMDFDEEILSYSSHEVIGTQTKVTFTAPTRTYSNDKTITVKVIIGGFALKANVTITTSGAFTTSGASGEILHDISIAFADDGTPTVTVKANGDSVPQTQIQPTNNASATTILNDGFYIEKVYFASGTEVATLTADPTTTATIGDLTPKFEVYLNADFVDPTTFSFTCVNVTDNNSVATFSTGDSAITIATASKKITFQVVSTSTPKLEAGKTYKVTLTTSIAKSGASNKEIQNVTRYFKTATNAQY